MPCRTCDACEGSRWKCVPPGTRKNNQPKATYQQETVDTIANLASATAHDCESVATLTTTIVTLTTEISATNSKLIQALAETTKLTDTVRELRRTTTKPRGGGASNPNRHYCWSCGYVSSHISWECPNPKDGHNKYAKAADTKGGSTRNKPSLSMPGANENNNSQLIGNNFL